MRYYLIALLVLIGFTSNAQLVKITSPNSTAWIQGRARIDSTAFVAGKDTVLTIVNGIISRTKVTSGSGSADSLTYTTIYRDDTGKIALRASIATKEPILSGTGFVKKSGTTTTYDNSTYLTSVPAQSFSSLIGKPITLSGYGITDAYPLSGNPSGFITSVPAQSFSSLTGKPTTLSGYGITDAYPLSGNPSNFLITVDSTRYQTKYGQDTLRTNVYNKFGSYYLASNPSGFLTIVDSTRYQTKYGVDTMRTNDQAKFGLYYLASNPNGYTANTGNVIGSASSTDNALVRFDGTTGKIIQDYTINPPTVTDSGVVFVGPSGIAAASTGTTLNTYTTDLNRNVVMNSFQSLGSLNTSGSSQALNFTLNDNGANNVGTMIGVNGISQKSGSGTVSSITGIQASTRITGSVTTVTAMNGFVSQPRFTGTSSAVGTLINFSATAATTGGTVTSAYGFKAASQKVSGVTTGYGFGMDGTSDINYVLGTLGVGTQSTSSLLTIAAGTATANTAQLKLTPGVNLTTPESGAIENNGTHLYYTNTSGTRLQLDQQLSGAIANAALTGTTTSTVTSQAAASSLIGTVANNSFIGAGGYAVGNYYPQYTLYTTDNNATVPKYSEIVQISGTGTFKQWYTSSNYAAAPTGVMSLSPSGALGVGNGGAVASAQLEVTSTTKGFLPPRMTSAQRTAISSPAKGLTVFNNDYNCLDYYDGANWRSTGSVSNTATVGISSATLNSTYPDAGIGFQVIANSITLGGAIYVKATESGSSDVWLIVSAPVAP